MADVNRYLSFPPEKALSAKEYDKQATEFVKFLTKEPEAHWLKHVKQQNILEVFNPAVHSLPYLIALYTQTHAAGKDRARHEDAVSRTVIFFSSFDPIQVRYAGEHFRALLEYAVESYQEYGLTDFRPIAVAMLRLDPTGGTFTSTHLRYVRLCLRAGVPSQALPILDKNIYAYPQTSPKNLPEELLCEEHELSSGFVNTKTGFSIPLRADFVLEYYLLGAHVYIGQRNYARARLFLECVLLTPSNNSSCSALQTEAYKKWILLGLLAQGKTYPLPRTHNQAIMKSLKSIGRSYEALAETFEKRDAKKLQAEMDQGIQIWNEDGNLRLVKEVSDALNRYRINDLQRTYAALPVSRVAKHLNLTPDATLRLLSDIIREGHINASITPAASNIAGDAVLHFHPNQTPQSEGDLAAQAKSIEELTTFIRDADRRVQLSKEYIEFAKRTRKGGAGPDGDLAESMDWDPPIGDLDDEDIMA